MSSMPHLAADLAGGHVLQQLPHLDAVGHAVRLLTCTAMHQQLQVPPKGPEPHHQSTSKASSTCDDTSQTQPSPSTYSFCLSMSGSLLSAALLRMGIRCRGCRWFLQYPSW